MRRIAILIACMVAIAGGSFAQGSPYAGMKARPIKALSGQQIDDYLAGRGMGFALAAELNRYPGPKHILELEERLGLSEDQKIAIATIHRSMSDEAVRLGKAIIHLEAQLDSLFSSGEINGEILESVLTQIAVKQGELRFVHLDAHLRTKNSLTPAQVTAYAKLRGYAQEQSPGTHHGH